MIGLHQGSDRIIDTSFDILALEALFLIPRICSPLLSLNPYFGTLLPCLTAMTKVCQNMLTNVSLMTDGATGLPQVPFARGNIVLRFLVNLLPSRQRPVHLSPDGPYPNEGFLWKLISGLRYKRQDLALSWTSTHADLHNVRISSYTNVLSLNKNFFADSKMTPA